MARSNCGICGIGVERKSSSALLLAVLSAIFALVMSMAISAAPPAAWADELQGVQAAQEPQPVETKYFYAPDPLGVGPKLQPSDLVAEQSDSGAKSGLSAQADVDVISYDDAVAALKQGMINRGDSVAVTIETDASYEQLWNRMLEDALAEDGDGQHGDYLRWVRGDTFGRVSAYPGDVYTTTYTFNLTYRTTLEQEQQVRAKANEVLDSLHKTRTMITDYQKIKAIYDYICENVTYDHDNLNDDSHQLKYTAYAALVNKTAVCQGYASLFYLMASIEGVSSRIIGGIGKTSADESEPHAWNIARIGSLYYNLDSTWDAVMFQAQQPYEYFLKSDSDFEVDHVRDNNLGDNGEVYGINYTSPEFYAAYPMGAESFVPGEFDDRPSLALATIELSGGQQTYDGNEKTPGVTVKLGDTVVAEDNYTVTYENNVNAGVDTAKVIVTGQGGCVGETEKTFTINPMAVEIPVNGAQSTVTYSGSEQEVSGYSITLPDGCGLTKNDIAYSGATTAKGANVGSYSAGLAADNFSITESKAANYDPTFTVVKDCLLTIDPATLTATYASEEIEFDGTPAYQVIVAPEGFVNGESEGTAAGYNAPAVVAPESLIAGETYELVPAGGSAKNYKFDYVAGTLTVKRAPVQDLIDAIGELPEEASDDEIAAYEQRIAEAQNALSSLTAEQLKRISVADIQKITDAETSAQEAHKPSLANATISVEGQTYTGKALTPDPVVVLGDTTLTKDVDYTVAYSNNTNAGNAVLTVTGAGSYRGTNSSTFKISKAANSLNIGKAKRKIKRKKLKKAKCVVAGVAVTAQGQGPMTYSINSVKKAKFKKKFSINKSTGKITVKKKTGKGTYKVTVAAVAAGDVNHEKSPVMTAVVTIKVS